METNCGDGESYRRSKFVEQKPAVTKVTAMASPIVFQLKLLYKNSLRQHHVNALVAVDQFGDVHVTGHAGEHVSVVAAEALGADQKVDHLAHGDARGFMQLRMKSHADVMRGRFRTRIFLAGTLVQDELERSHQRCF